MAQLNHRSLPLADNCFAIVARECQAKSRANRKAPRFERVALNRPLSMSTSDFARRTRGLWLPLLLLLLACESSPPAAAADYDWKWRTGRATNCEFLGCGLLPLPSSVCFIARS